MSGPEPRDELLPVEDDGDLDEDEEDESMFSDSDQDGEDLTNSYPFWRAMRRIERVADANRELLARTQDVLETLSASSDEALQRAADEMHAVRAVLRDITDDLDNAVRTMRGARGRLFSFSAWIPLLVGMDHEQRRLALVVDRYGAQLQGEDDDYEWVDAVLALEAASPTRLPELADTQTEVEDQQCPICCDRAVSVHFQPCGHLFCLTCTRSFRRDGTLRILCPMCRGQVDAADPLEPAIESMQLAIESGNDLEPGNELANEPEL